MFAAVTQAMLTVLIATQVRPNLRHAIWVGNVAFRHKLVLSSESYRRDLRRHEREDSSLPRDQQLRRDFPGWRRASPLEQGGRAGRRTLETHRGSFSKLIARLASRSNRLAVS